MRLHISIVLVLAATISAAPQDNTRPTRGHTPHIDSIFQAFYQQGRREAARNTIIRIGSVILKAPPR